MSQIIDCSLKFGKQPPNESIWTVNMKFCTADTKSRFPFSGPPRHDGTLKYSRMHKDVKYGRMNQLVLLRSERVRRRVWQYPRGGILRGLAPRGFMGHFVYARTGQGCPVVHTREHACTSADSGHRVVVVVVVFFGASCPREVSAKRSRGFNDTFVCETWSH